MANSFSHHNVVKNFNNLNRQNFNFDFYISTKFKEDDLNQLQNFEKQLNDEIQEREEKEMEASDKKYKKSQWLQKIVDKIGCIWTPEKANINNNQDSSEGGKGSRKRRRKNKNKKNAQTNEVANKNQVQDEKDQQQKQQQNEEKEIIDKVSEILNKNQALAEQELKENNPNDNQDPIVYYNQNNPFDISNALNNNQNNVQL